MATIGDISFKFSSDIDGLRKGVADASALIKSLHKDVEGVSKSLKDSATKPIKLKAEVDSKAIKDASAEVDELEKKASAKSPKIKFEADASQLKSLIGTFKAGMSAGVSDFGQSLKEIGENAGTAAKATGSAFTSIGGVLDGTNATLEGVVSSVVRTKDAFLEWKGAVASAAAAGETFLGYAGGLSTVMAAAGGNVAAGGRLLSAAGASAVSAAAGMASYSAIMAVVKVATAGLGEETKKVVEGWASTAAAATSAAVALGAGDKAFAAIAKTLSESSTAAQFFSKTFSQAASAASAGASRIVSSLGQITTVLAAAKVFSGGFKHELEGLGESAKQIENMSQRFGSTAEQVQVLEYAAKSAGVGMGQLAKAQQAFYTNVSKVKLGQLNTETTKEAKIAFDRLGISISDLRNKKPEEVFELVGARLEGVKDASLRSAIAFDLFGKQGGNILPALRGLKEAAEDAKRLGTVMSQGDFKMFKGVDQSFDRLKNASSNLAATFLVSFAPIQTGWNNLMADLKGGLVAALGPIRSLMAAVFVPFQVFMEVIGRLINMILRLVGVATKIAVAFAAAPSLAAAWTAFGDVIKEALAYLEQGISYAEAFANAFSTALTPAIEEGATWLDKLTFAAKTFATVVVSGAVASAVMQSFGIQAGAAFLKIAAGMASVNFAGFFSGLVGWLKFLTIGVTQASITFVKNMIVMGVSAIANFVTPAVAGMMTFVASLFGATAAAQVSAVAMAAAWVIATLGLALIVVAIIAVYQNFDKLSDYFSNFSENVGKLFTFEGLAEAATAVVDAIKNAFGALFSWIGGFFGGIIKGIVQGMAGIEPPKKIEASTSNVDQIIESRSAIQSANAAAEEYAATWSGVAATKPPVEDLNALKSSIEQNRSDMIDLSMEATRFGEAGKSAFLAAKEDFNRLQQQVADGTLSPEKFDEESRKIKERLKENLNLANVISPEQMQQSAENMRKNIDGAMAKVRAIGRGTDTGSTLSVDRFFPTSDAIKQKAAEFASQYEQEQKDIERRFQSGGFGKGVEAIKARDKALEESQNNFDRNMGKIEADTSFADDIRKKLETAFLTPAEMLEKKLQEIAENKSLSPEQKAKALAMERKQFVEEQFGKTAGRSLSEKQQSLNTAIQNRAFKDTPGRAGVEQRKLDVERRKALGLDETATQKLKAGADNIADIFGMTGSSLEDVRASLAGSPEKLKEFDEAVRKNADAAKAAVGVEVPASRKLAEAQARLADAQRNGIVSMDEAGAATRRLKDDFMSAIGVAKTPFEEFSGQMDNIAEQFGMVGQPLDEVRKNLEGNAEKLALFDRAVKTARDNLLSSLGVEKSPQQVFKEQMAKIEEAVNAEDPNKRITAEQAKDAMQAARKKRDEALGAGGASDNFAADFREQKKRIEEAFGKDGAKDPERFRLAMEKLNQSVPGAEAENPISKFNNQLAQLNALNLDPNEFNARKLNLQAQLQEDLKPALDKMAPDRRSIDVADARSKSGVDTFFRILRGNDNPSLKAQLEVARNTRLLAEAAKNPDAAPVIAQLAAR